MKQSELLRKIYWVSGFLLLFVLAFAASVTFLNPSSVGNRNFLWNFHLWASVWALIFIVILILSFVLARNLIRLFFEYQTRHPGSKIKSKLVSTFIIFSLFPALIMAFLAFGLINQNLTKWASAPSEQLLESSQTIAERFYAEKERDARSMAELLSDWWVQRPQDVNGKELREKLSRYGFDGAVIVDADGRQRAVGRPLSPELTEEVLAQTLGGEIAYSVHRRVNLEPGIVDRGVVGAPLVTSEGSLTGSLLLGFEIPESVIFETAKVEEANEVYTSLKGTLDSLRLTYFLVLAMTTLAVVFGFVWLGSYIAGKLTGPLEALAEGSRELAEGNLGHRVEVQAVDELGIVVTSFNRMAEQLRDNQTQLEDAYEELKETNVHLDERRQYIETVLQNIATGVLTVDKDEVIRTANQAALKMLRTSPEKILGRPIEEVTETGLCEEFRSMKKHAELYRRARKQITIRRKGGPVYLAATITNNTAPLSNESEYLIVLDDVTELIRAEKFAAWQGVARRLAHEIKNPLTPIQLSAQRINRRFERLQPLLPPTPGVEDFQEILRDGTRIIEAESRILKNLLSEFSRFARLPMCQPESIDLHALIRETLQRYNGGLDPIEVREHFDTEVEKIQADPEQLQRVFVNLINNSMDALVDQPDGRVIDISTKLNQSRNSVTIEVADTGSGIETSDYDHLFLPYFSTKKKGTGLGLAIVRQIISEHNGFIRAEPNEPRGTRISMELPLA